jgi:O-antigen ligase
LVRLADAFRGAGAWLTAARSDHDRAVSAFIFLFGAAIIPLGSVTTGIFFLSAAYCALQLWRGHIRWVLPTELRVPMVISLAYFVGELLSPLLFSPAGPGWFQVGGALHFLALPLVLMGFSQAYRRDRLDIFLNGLRCGVIAGCVVALIQVLLFKLGRAEAGMGNPIPYGNISLLAGMMSLIGLERLTRRLQMVAVLAAVSGLAGCLLSETRGAFLILPMIPVVLVLTYWPSFLKNRRSMIGALLALVVGMGALVVFLSYQPRFQNFAFSLSSYDRALASERSIADRALMLRYGYDATLDRPWLGYGTQNRVLEVMSRAKAAGKDLHSYTHLHNEFLNNLVGKGLIGLITLLLLLAAPLIVLKGSDSDPQYRARRVFALLLVGGYIAFGMSAIVFGHDLLNTFYVTALLTLCLSSGESDPEEPGAPP